MSPNAFEPGRFRERMTALLLPAWLVTCLLIFGCSEPSPQDRPSESERPPIPGDESAKAEKQDSNETGSSPTADKQTPKEHDGEKLAGIAPAKGEPPQGKEPAEPVSVQLVGREGYEQALARHRGKVVLVDFWATWCLPCVNQFPHTIELAEKYTEQGLALVTLSMDEPKDQQAVERFLAEQGAAPYSNLLTKYGAGTRSAEEFEMPGGVPLYKLYDRSGELRYQFGPFPEKLEHGEQVDQIENRVEELLAELPQSPKAEDGSPPEPK